MAAVFGYLNVRFLKLPNVIGLMLITIIFTLLVFAISYVDDTLLDAEKYILTQIDFRVILLDIMLPGLSGYRVLQELRSDGVAVALRQ